MKLQTREESQVVPKLPLTWSTEEDKPAEAATAVSAQVAESRKADGEREAVPEELQAAVTADENLGDSGKAEDVSSASSDDIAESDDRIDACDGEAGYTDEKEESAEDGQTPVSAEEIIVVENFGESVGAELHRIRSDLKLRVADVASKVRVTATFIRDLEHDNFENLPPLEMCEERIEKLCFVYDVNPEKLLERFSEEYTKALAESPVISSDEINAERTQNGKYYRRGLADAELPKGYRNTPSILIMILIVAIAGLLAYAFVSYMSHKPEERLNVELMDYIPTPQPKILPIDGGK